MNKSELVTNIATESGLTKIDSEKALNATIKCIISTVSNGEPVKLVGFGNFELIGRAEKKARNPKTGKEVIVPAHKVPKFKVSKNFKNSLMG